MFLVLAVLFCLAAWRWGDWRNLHRYYPTILFMIAANLFYEFVCSNYALWTFEPHNTVFKNSNLIALVFTFGIFPPTVLLYLSRYPQGMMRQLRYNLFWIVFYLALEYLAYRNHMISYHHGWSFGWSILFDLLMFPILRLHHNRPLLGWVAALLYTVWAWKTFDILFHLPK